MRGPRLGARAEVKRVVLVPLPDRVRMAADESFGIVALRRSAAKPADFIDFQVSKYAVMAVPAVEQSEQAEEQKHVADADIVLLQMLLRPSARMPNVHPRT